jgi:RNA polymerase sigma factor (sigma-70 family)
MAAATWEVLEAHRASLTAFLRGKCRNDADVEDCVQEAILRAAQIPHLDPDRVSGLLKKIGYHLVVDMHRERQRRARALARHGVTLEPSPDEVALDRQHARALAMRATKLSSFERHALRGRIEGFNPSETAARLGVPAKTVHLALSRARAALRAVSGPAAIIVWLRRRCSVGMRTGGAMSAAVSLAGLSLLLGHGHDATPRSGHPPVLRVLDAQSQTAPLAPEHRPISPYSGLARPPIHAHAYSAAPPRTTVVQVVSPAPHTLQAGIGVTRSNWDESILSGLAACLQPGAVSLDLHHAGCDN